MGLRPPGTKKLSKSEQSNRAKAIQYTQILSRIDDGDIPENIAKTKGMPTAQTIRKWLKNGGPGNDGKTRAKNGAIHLTEEVFERIITRFSKGETITSSCEQEGVCRSLFYAMIRKRDNWMDKYTEAQDLFHESRMDRAYKIAEESLDDDGIDPRRASFWFQVNKYGMNRAGPSRFNGERMVSSDSPIRPIDPDYVESD
jgi:hypothetical protein